MNFSCDAAAIFSWTRESAIACVAQVLARTERSEVDLRPLCGASRGSNHARRFPRRTEDKTTASHAIMEAIAMARHSHSAAKNRRATSLASKDLRYKSKAPPRLPVAAKRR
jgi:hypothetical protein